MVCYSDSVERGTRTTASASYLSAPSTFPVPAIPDRRFPNRAVNSRITCSVICFTQGPLDDCC